MSSMTTPAALAVARPEAAESCENRDVVEEPEKTRTHRASAIALEGTRRRHLCRIKDPPLARPYGS